MKKLRVGLIGCGGRSGDHMASLEQMDDVVVAAVADPVEERRTAAAKRFGCNHIYEDHTDLYDHESRDTLDAVIICIEPTAHTDSETRAIDMGIPFLVEKPMTLDLSQAEDIVRRLDETGLVSAVGFQDRYLNLMDIVKEELPKHKTGGLVSGAWVGGIPGVWWWQKKSTCGGQLVEQNIHLVDGLRYLYGEPLSVYATCSRGIVVPGKDAPESYDTDDHSTAVIRFNGNVTATLTSGCYLNGVDAHSGLIITLNDMIIDYKLRNRLTLKTAEETRIIKAKQDQTYHLDKAFLDAVRAGDPTAVRSPYKDALKSLKLGFAANQSMETGEVINF